MAWVVKSNTTDNDGNPVYLTKYGSWGVLDRAKVYRLESHALRS